jgi:hypothetical protein
MLDAAPARYADPEILQNAHTVSWAHAQAALWHL